MLTRTLLALVVIMMVGRAWSCPHPSGRCKCSFPEYPCSNDFSYGCRYGKCWSQCAAILGGCKEWCYTKSVATGAPYYCKSNEDCVDGASCALSKCDGGCTVAKSDNVYRRLLLGY